MERHKMRLVRNRKTLDTEEITYQSVLEDALKGISEGVVVLCDIMHNAESDKDRIAAVNGLLNIGVKLAGVAVVEQLPLLKKLEEDVRKSA